MEIHPFARKISMSFYTLALNKPDEELKCRAYMEEHNKMPRGIIIISYLSVVAHFLFRLYTLIAAILRTDVKNYSMITEIVLMMMLLLAGLLEVVVRKCNLMKQYHGIFIYSALPMIILTSSLSYNATPYFGISAAFILMGTQGTISVFTNSWKASFIGNCVLTLYAHVFWLVTFSKVLLVREAIVGSLSILFGVNYHTVLMYMQEKSHREQYLIKRELQESEARWKGILNDLPVGILLAGRLNNIKYLNKEMQKIGKKEENLGISNGNALLNESTVGITQPHEFSPSLFEHLVVNGEEGKSLPKILTDEASEDAERVYNMVSNETKKSYEVKTKLFLKSPTKCNKILVCKDQSVFEELIKQKTLEKYQRMLLSSISHEIRNPLHAIEGYRSMILESSSLSKIQANSGKLGCATQQIDLIVSGACELMVNDSKTYIIQPEAFNIFDAIQQMLSIVSPVIEAKNITFKIEVLGTLPDIFYSEPKKYQLILFHLLSNAAKYTQTGSIVLDVKFDIEAETLTTRITDTGIGMKEDKISTLFKMYSNVNTANPYNPQGMGLGLALCKKLVTLLGGTITVKSIYGQGSEFEFTIKYYQALQANEIREMVPLEDILGGANKERRLFIPRSGLGLDEEHANRTGGTTSCDCPMALVVDDEPTNRTVIKHYLSFMKCQADEAGNGLEAINMVRERALNSCCKKYTIIFMDVNMPIMDGTTAASELTKMFANGTAPNTPIVAVTAANIQSRQDIQALLSIGFNDIWQKPLRKEEFIAKARAYFQHNYNQPRGARSIII
eukprot:TRINITY_DN1771_c0_g1_i2.p1 TRINITY_DN1771_c0_g1~~TRINITY_DN1771_c0_g1_i2.p1  ORF type:complete len:803 (-),score=118.01 TRINITY_DN1771_c0_g1_i2:12-2378(-)